MKKAWLGWLCLCAAAQTGDWTVWSAREELRPVTARDGEWLIIRGGGRAESYGGWVRLIEGIRGSAWYRPPPSTTPQQLRRKTGR